MCKFGKCKGAYDAMVKLEVLASCNLTLNTIVVLCFILMFICALKSSGNKIN